MTFSRQYAKARKFSNKKETQPNKGTQAQRFQRQQPAQNESQPFPWRKVFRIFIVILLFFVFVIAWQLRHQIFFPIKQVSIQGQINRVDQKSLQAIVDRYGQGSLLLLSPQAMRKQLEAIPWVMHANVVRQWPDTLAINITEYTPVAHFNNLILTNSGKLLVATNNANDMASLPLIIGPEDQALTLWQNFTLMNSILEGTGLKIIRMEVSARGAYELTMNTGLVVYLGNNYIVDRLSSFAKIYRQNLVSRAEQLAYADMRYSSGMALSWKSHT